MGHRLCCRIFGPDMARDSIRVFFFFVTNLFAHTRHLAIKNSVSGLLGPLADSLPGLQATTL